MKVTVTKEYNLPEEQEILNIHNNAEDYYSAIEDIRSFTRNILKYSNIADETKSVIHELRNLLPEDII